MVTYGKWSLTGSFTDSNLTDAEQIGILVRWSLTGGGRVREVSLIAIRLTEEQIGILVRWSLKRGGRLREVSL